MTWSVPGGCSLGENGERKLRGHPTNSTRGFTFAFKPIYVCVCVCKLTYYCINVSSTSQLSNSLVQNQYRTNKRKTWLEYYSQSAAATFTRSVVRSLFLSVKSFFVWVKAALGGTEHGPRWSLCHVVGGCEEPTLDQKTVELIIIDPRPPLSTPVKLVKTAALWVNIIIHRHDYPATFKYIYAIR